LLLKKKNIINKFLMRENMKYNFETLINRNNQGSSKWNLMKPGTPENIAPFSVADVDMPLAPEIKNGLINFLENDAVLGYTNPNDEYYQAVIIGLHVATIIK